jgi:hypothetical protein
MEVDVTKASDKVSNKQYIMLNGYSIMGITDISGNLRMNNIISTKYKNK